MVTAGSHVRSNSGGGAVPQLRAASRDDPSERLAATGTASSAPYIARPEARESPGETGASIPCVAFPTSSLRILQYCMMANYMRKMMM